MDKFRSICYTVRGKILVRAGKMNLLIFTALILLVFGLILQSNPKIRTNQCCFVGGCIFAGGVLKEYLYYHMGPRLIEKGIWTAHFSELLYGALSTLLYYFALPTVMVFCYYFCGLDQKMSRFFRSLCLLPYLPAVIMCIIYPWQNIIIYQKDRVFCLSVGFYNVGYAALAIGLLVAYLWKNRQKGEFYQKVWAAMCIIAMLVFWILTSFPYQALGIDNLQDLWQFNVVMVAAVLAFVVFRLFHGGIWGMRLRLEHYNWTDSARTIRQNARYVSHALKNELSKIEWSLQLLEKKGISAEELGIIRHSTEYLKRFVYETQIYSDSITLNPAWCDVSTLLEEAQEDLKRRNKKIAEVTVTACDTRMLYCDRIHTLEVLKNLLINAADAGESRETIELSYTVSRAGNAVISVKDNGRGISEADIRQIFEPYYTTKQTERNMGLGLYYCWNVMNAHGGRIEVKSREGDGSEFKLCFPAKRERKHCLGRKEKRDAGDETNSYTGC